MKKITHKIKFRESSCTLISNSQQAINQALDQLYEDSDVMYDFTLQYPGWKKSYEPIRIDTEKGKAKHPLIEKMEKAAIQAQVGPMAAVAGALADRMQENMLTLPECKIAVIENGGEIAIKSQEEIIIGLLVLSNSLKNKIGFRYAGNNQNLGVATSSATFGHADSLGEADAVVVFAPNAALADAAATKICNEVKGSQAKDAILRGLAAYRTIPSLFGVFIVKEDLTAQEGKLPEFIHIDDPDDVLLQEYIN